MFSFFASHGVLFISGVEKRFCLWSFLIIFTKQTTKSGLKFEKQEDQKIAKVAKKRFHFP